MENKTDTSEEILELMKQIPWKFRKAVFSSSMTMTLLHAALRNEEEGMGILKRDIKEMINGLKPEQLLSIYNLLLSFDVKAIKETEETKIKAEPVIIEDKVKIKRSYEEGYEAGKKDGMNKGTKMAEKKAFNKGELEGYAKGYKDGEKEGFKKGVKEGNNAIDKKSYEKGFLEGKSLRIKELKRMREF
ncbi:hypothetical protein AB1283_00805 [Bacillus sp. S13(2024)]|uniref:hypothetical protein n=1 Tax=Bacillus sp. S13(2024) TaxID=3162885 RepID=UPI003D1DA8BC